MSIVFGFCSFVGPLIRFRLGRCFIDDYIDLLYRGSSYPEEPGRYLRELGYLPMVLGVIQPALSGDIFCLEPQHLSRYPIWQLFFVDMDGLTLNLRLKMGVAFVAHQLFDNWFQKGWKGIIFFFETSTVLEISLVRLQSFSFQKCKDEDSREFTFYGFSCKEVLPSVSLNTLSPGLPGLGVVSVGFDEAVKPVPSFTIHNSVFRIMVSSVKGRTEILMVSIADGFVTVVREERAIYGSITGKRSISDGLLTKLRYDCKFTTIVRLLEMASYILFTSTVLVVVSVDGVFDLHSEGLHLLGDAVYVRSNRQVFDEIPVTGVELLQNYTLEYWFALGDATEETEVHDRGLSRHSKDSYDGKQLNLYFGFENRRIGMTWHCPFGCEVTRFAKKNWITTTIIDAHQMFAVGTFGLCNMLLVLLACIEFDVSRHIHCLRLLVEVFTVKVRLVFASHDQVCHIIISREEPRFVYLYDITMFPNAVWGEVEYHGRFRRSKLFGSNFREVISFIVATVISLDTTRQRLKGNKDADAYDEMGYHKVLFRDEIFEILCMDCRGWFRTGWNPFQDMLSTLKGIGYMNDVTGMQDGAQAWGTLSDCLWTPTEKVPARKTAQVLMHVPDIKFRDLDWITGVLVENNTAMLSISLTELLDTVQMLGTPGFGWWVEGSYALVDSNRADDLVRRHALLSGYEHGQLAATLQDVNSHLAANPAMLQIDTSRLQITVDASCLQLEVMKVPGFKHGIPVVRLLPLLRGNVYDAWQNTLELQLGDKNFKCGLLAAPD